MAGRIRTRWSPEAKSDLKHIFEYIAADKLAPAKRTVSEIRRLAKGIGEYPEIGRVVPEFGIHAIRERIYGMYRIIYRLKPDEIEILNIYHSAEPLGDNDE